MAVPTAEHQAIGPPASSGRRIFHVAGAPFSAAALRNEGSIFSVALRSPPASHPLLFSSHPLGLSFLSRVGGRSLAAVAVPTVKQ